MRRLYTIFTLLFTVIVVFAQRVTVSMPSHVAVGEQFQIEYTVNTQDVRGFNPGHMPNGIELLYGPSTSSQSSFQIVNGHTSSSSTVTYTYVAVATKKGTFTIPAAHANAGGKVVSSSPVRLSASGNSKVNVQPHSQSRQMDDDPYVYHHSSARVPSGEDLFIHVTANKQRVHEQEPVLLTYKVYTLVELTQLDGKMPDLKGFHTQEIKQPQQKTYHREEYHGRTYNCVTWSQYVVFPQMTGKLVIPEITFQGVVLHETRDPIAFITGRGYEEERRSIKAPGLTIQVDPLPTRPQNFSGGVGKFTISGQINKNTIKAGDPVNLRVVVSGSGNLKLIKQPEVTVPEGWDKYDAKITDKTRLSMNGVEGNMIYDILVVPRKEGNYTIPPVKLTYYDTGANAYKTVQTGSFSVNVEPGDGGSSAGVADYSQNKVDDIRPIKEGKVRLHNQDDFFFGTPWYCIILLALFVIFVGLLILFRRTALAHADIARMRGKNANKVANKHLRKAYGLIQTNAPSAFYDEVLRALWGYVGDKLNMPVTELSRDNISDRFAEHNVDEETINMFISALDECEMERYAPGDTRGNMNKTYDAAMTAISRIENVMNGKGNSSKDANDGGMKCLLITLVMMSFVSAVNAVTKANADTEYKKGNFQQAIKDYEEILDNGVSSELYYNLGNAYYRTDNITQAVIAYERALLLSPGDKDIRVNLQMAQSKTIDKITPESEMFLVTWYKSLVNLMSVDGWAYTAIFCMIVIIMLVLIYLFSDTIWLRKVGFFGGIIFFLLFIASNIFALQQRSTLLHRNGAVIISSSATIRKNPATSAPEETILHEGTRVEIIDRSMNGWYGIRIADGREGWIENKNVEVI